MADMSKDASWVQIFAVLITGVFTVVGVLLSQARAYHFAQRAKRFENQQKAYAALQGLRQLTIQTLVSAMQARIDMEYFTHIFVRDGRDHSSWQFEQSKVLESRFVELTLEAAKVRQAVAEAVGLAQANFPTTPRLAIACERMYHAPGAGYHQPKISTEPGLTQWRDEAVLQVREWIEQQYGQLFGQLLDELRQLLPSDPDHRHAN